MMVMILQNIDLHYEENLQELSILEFIEKNSKNITILLIKKTVSLSL